MGDYTAKIKDLYDYRNRLVAIDFDYRAKINHQEILLIQTLRDLFKIPNEANINVKYEIDGELCLTSDLRLNIHNVKGFPLIRSECNRVVNNASSFSIVEPEVKYRYYFKI